MELTRARGNRAHGNRMYRTALRDCLIISGVVAIAYGSALAGIFAGDDLILVENARSASWAFSDLARAFEWDEHDVTDGWLPPTFRTFRLQYFRPVVVASIKLDFTLWGHWPPGYFFTNLVLYFLIAVLVYAWGADFGLHRRDRLLLAVLFVSYSVNSVAVNRINGRTELIAALFLLASVVALGRYHTRRAPWLLAAALTSGVLALGTKENCVMLPFFHIVSALFLYRDPKSPGTYDRWRIAWAIAPFFALVPLYFLVRGAALDGFPIPPRGFYFHHPADSGFYIFVVAKLIHAPLALLFQLPAQLFPVFLERSLPLLLTAAALSLPTVWFTIRMARPPFRYFLLGWIGIALAPTIPMGYNSLYFFLCSPLVALLYIHCYHHARASRRARIRNAARPALIGVIVLGIVVCNGSTFAVRNEGLPAREAANAIGPLLEQHAGATHVYLIDVPPACIYTLKPAIAYYLPHHADKAISTLSVTADLAGHIPSVIEQFDGFTFDIAPERGAYLRTGLEEILLQRPLPTYAPGMIARDEQYAIEVMEVENTYVREEGALVRRLRDHFSAPPAHQRGILRLRFRFESPLAAPDSLFIQLGDRGARVVDFK